MEKWRKFLVEVNLFLLALNIVLMISNWKEGVFSGCFANIIAMACNAFCVWRLSGCKNV